MYEPPLVRGKKKIENHWPRAYHCVNSALVIGKSLRVRISARFERAI